jgi:stage V sporulation protein D (sporulation-specific penicillin-binding protein)
MTDLDLAIYAFGQNFNITPIQHMMAIASVANGGYLLEPYLVEQITDNSGNVIYQHQTEAKRQVISKDVCEKLSVILEEGVSGDGGAKNVYVAGYKIAAKTGTSEKKGTEIRVENVEPYICSCVAFAPADDPEIAILIMVDEPSRGVLYGSVIAAPYMGNLMEAILPYIGVEKDVSKDNSVKVPYLTGMSLEEAILQAESFDYTCIKKFICSIFSYK